MSEAPEVLLGCLMNGVQFIGKVRKRGTAGANGSMAETIIFDHLAGIGYESASENRISVGFMPLCIAAEEEPIPLRVSDLLFAIDAPLKVREKFLAWISPIIQAKAVPTMGLVKPS